MRIKKVEKKTSVRKELLWLYLAHGMNYVVPVMITVYLARILSPEVWGKAVYVLSISQYVTLIVDYAFHLSAQREVAESDSDHKKIEKILGSVQCAKIILFLACAPFVVAVCALLLKLEPTEIVVILIMGYGQGSAYFWLFRGLGRSILYSKLDILSKVVVGLLIFTMIKSQNDIFLYYGIVLFGVALTGVVSQYYIKYIFGYKYYYSISGAVEKIKANGTLFKMHFIGSAYGIAPITTIGYLSGGFESGIYATADKLIKPVAGLLEPIRTAMFPRIIKALSECENESPVYKKLLVTSGGGMIIAGLMLSLSVYFLAPYVVKILFGPAYESAVNVLRILSIMPLLIAFNNVFNVFILIPLNLERNVLYFVACGLITFLTMTFAIDLVAGSQDMAIVAIVSEIVVVSLAAYFAIKSVLFTVREN